MLLSSITLGYLLQQQELH